MPTERGPGDASGGYLPALRFDGLVRIYDPLLEWAMRDTTWKRRFLREVPVEADHRVLDLGCGTGTLLALLAEEVPGAEAVGLDPDATVLGLAGEKVPGGEARPGLLRGLGHRLPLEEDAFDVVLTTLVFHHLPTGDKRATLDEARRVLAPDGALGLADLGRPSGLLMKAASVGPYVFDGPSRTGANFRGELPRLLAEAGFQGVEETGATDTLFGTVRRWRARAP